MLGYIRFNMREANKYHSPQTTFLTRANLASNKSEKKKEKKRKEKTIPYVRPLVRASFHLARCKPAPASPHRGMVAGFA